MNRDHRIITISVNFLATVPAGYDCCGQVTGMMQERQIQTLRVIATSAEVALAVLKENPFRYPEGKFSVLSIDKIDTIVETHTY